MKGIPRKQLKQEADDRLGVSHIQPYPLLSHSLLSLSVSNRRLASPKP